MRHRGGRAEPRRIIAFGHASEIGRGSADFRFCSIVLVGSLAVLLLVVGTLAINRPLVHGMSQVRAERWLLGTIALVAAALAFVSGRLLLRRWAQRPRPPLII